MKDARAVERFTVDMALAENARDQAWRRRTEQLWDHMNLRGQLLMGRRDLRAAGAVHDGFGVAAGS